MIKSLKCLSILVGLAQPLTVSQLVDSVILEKNEYIMLENFNKANFMSRDSMTYNQTIDVHITNNFENFKFDVLIFDVDEKTGKNEDFECYKAAVITKSWRKGCDFLNQ